MHAEEDFVLKIIGHNAIESPGVGGKVLRLYVQLRRSEEDALPPDFKPRTKLFKLGSAFGDATLKEVGTFGGKKAKGRGASTLLMIDISGSMVQFWDIIHSAAMASIDNMGPGDQLGIAFFGGDWVFSGLKSQRNAAQLKSWVSQQLPTSVFEWSKKRRDMGRKAFMSEYGHGIKWWQEYLDPVTDVRTTKLYHLMYSKAFPAIAAGTREVKALVILSDMMDESGWVDQEGGTPLDGPCEPENNCATDHVRQKAEETRVGVFGIGFRRFNVEEDLIENRADLDTFKLLALQSRGEYRETADLSEMKSLFEGVRTGLDRLIVADAEFCNLPSRSGFNYITMKYDDPGAHKRVDSMSYKVSFEELENSAACPKPCDPPCAMTHRCKEGKCEKIMPPPCCEENAQCESPKLCLSPAEAKEFDQKCLAFGGKNCSLRKGCHPACSPGQVCEDGTCVKTDSPTEKPECDTCEEWNDKAGQCQYKRCDNSEDDWCNVNCKCVKGTGDMFDHCEPLTGVPTEEIPDGSECVGDEHCIGKCDGAIPCICVLETPDPEQCLLEPEKREGAKVCEKGPQKCAENEFLFEDSQHCGCLECETDDNCVKDLSPQYACTGARGETRICERKSSIVKEILKYAIPGIIVLLLVIFLFKILRPTDPLKRKGAAKQGPKSMGPKAYESKDKKE